MSSGRFSPSYARHIPQEPTKNKHRPHSSPDHGTYIIKAEIPEKRRVVLVAKDGFTVTWYSREVVAF